MKFFSNVFSKLGAYGPHTLWLLSDKIFKLLIGLFVTVWVARYLGPEQFGIFNYVLSFVALFAPIAKLGLDGIVSRNIAECKSGDRLEELIATSLFLKVIGSLLLLVVTVSYMYFIEGSVLHVVLGLFFALVFCVRSLEVSEFYFRINIKGRVVALANAAGVIGSSLLKAVFIMGAYPLVYFAFANFVEAALAMLCLVFVFLKYVRVRVLNFNLGLALRLLRESWPLVVSGFSALVYLYIDQIMIEKMLGSQDLGQYSVASRLSSAVYFIPLTISWAMQSALIKEKKKGLDYYHRFISSMCSILFLLAIGITVPVFVFSDWIVNSLFGDAYSEAASVLEIHMWACVFVFLGAPRGLWVTSESMFRFDMLTNILGGIINIVLNYLMLPVYGIVGAAWATLVSYSFVYLISGFVYGPVRVVAWLQLKSVFSVFSVWRHGVFWGGR